jgi:hypothetical protein
LKDGPPRRRVGLVVEGAPARRRFYQHSPGKALMLFFLVLMDCLYKRAPRFLRLKVKTSSVSCAFIVGKVLNMCIQQAL